MPTVLTLMDDICAWLRANDIEPADVPLNAVPTLADGQITCPVHLRRGGSKYLDGGKVARGSVTVPLKSQPPAVLDGWLAGLVPAP